MLVGTPANLLTTPTAQPRSLPCPAAVVPPLAMAHAMAHVADARAGAGPGRSPCISITLLAWAACCLSTPHLPLPPQHRNLADVALRCLAAHSQEYPPSQDDGGPLYGAVYGVYHLLRQPLPSDCEWQRLLTSGHPPAVPLLSALAPLVSLCTNLLYSIFFILF